MTGKHDELHTGAHRDLSPDRQERYDLITPYAILRLARAYAEGAAKYGDRNWERGLPASNLINHALRHIYLWLMGRDDEDHLSHATWNLCALMHFENTKPELIDIPTRPDAYPHEPGKKRELFYLASPYSHPDYEVREQRYRAAREITAALLERGWLVHSPIVATHALVAYGLGSEFYAWQSLDMRLLDCCDGLLVATIPGWQESVGVTAEIEYMRRRGKPVLYVVPEKKEGEKLLPLVLTRPPKDATNEPGHAPVSSDQGAA
jgi:hypothetical protein